MRRSGVILAAVLVVTVLASMVAAGVLFRMHAESSASVAAANGEQAYQAAMSGLQMVLALLAPADQTAAAADPSGATIPTTTFANPTILADPTKWYDNETLFKDRLVTDDGVNRWYFSIYSANLIEADKVRFGITDESGKININTADEATLLRLPGMTPQLVAALMDYRDADSDTRPDGAEQEYYDQLKQPYTIRNGPLQSIEELLLIRGFTGAIVYGEDANFNTLLEPNEDDADETFPPDNNDGKLDMGLFGAATTLSSGPDIKGDGTQKVNINGSVNTVKQAATSAGLSSETSRFIELFRNDGGRFKHPSELLNMTYTLKKDVNQGGGGGKGKGKGGGRDGSPRAGDRISSGVTVDDMPAVMSTFTVQPNAVVPVVGMLNVNTASPAALAALPGVDSGLAQQIVEARANLDAETRSTTAWLVTQGVLDADTYKSVAPRLCTQGYQFRLRIVGFGVPCGRYRIFEVVLDVSTPQPRVLYQRDITRLGLPFALDPGSEEL